MLTDNLSKILSGKGEAYVVDGVVRTPNDTVSTYLKPIHIKYSAGSDSITKKILRAAHGYWGSGLFKIEIYKDYYDGRNTTYVEVLARLHTHYQHSPSCNILQISGNGVLPTWSGITYPDGEQDGSIGYAELSLAVSAYTNGVIVITPISYNEVDEDAVHGRGNVVHYYR